MTDRSGMAGNCAAGGSSSTALGGGVSSGGDGDGVRKLEKDCLLAVLLLHFSRLGCGPTLTLSFRAVLDLRLPRPLARLGASVVMAAGDVTDPTGDRYRPLVPP